MRMMRPKPTEAPVATVTIVRKPVIVIGSPAITSLLLDAAEQRLRQQAAEATDDRVHDTAPGRAR